MKKGMEKGSKQASLKEMANINAPKLLKETLKNFNEKLKSKGGFFEIKYNIELIKQKINTLNIKEKKAFKELIKRFIQFSINQRLKTVNSQNNISSKLV